MVVDLINKLVEAGIASVAAQPRELPQADLATAVASILSRENRHFRSRLTTDFGQALAKPSTLAYVSSATTSLASSQE